jgi:spore coat polysaccharide biosynthesis protein SpsF
MNVAVIQARMSSTRLPGKVLRKLGETTILDSVVERLKDSLNVERIVVATTTSISDESIFAHCKSKPIEVIRGPEEDVLLRVVSSVEEDFKGNILRITADCPFIDPGLIDSAFEKFIELDLDHIGIATGAGVANMKSMKYPDGLDAEWVKFSALKVANKEATETLDREHVTSYIWRNPAKFKLGLLQPTEDYSDVKLTIDTHEDLANMIMLSKLLGGSFLGVDFRHIVATYRLGITKGHIKPPVGNPNYAVFYEHGQ